MRRTKKRIDKIQLMEFTKETIAALDYNEYKVADKFFSNLK